MFLNEINLETFKSHLSLNLPLKRFTIFIGPNSSGKSSIFQAILMLKRSLENIPPPNGFITNPDSVELGKFKDIVTLGQTTDTVSIGIKGNNIFIPGLFEVASNLQFDYNVSVEEEGLTDVSFKAEIDDHTLVFDSKRNENPVVRFKNNISNVQLNTQQPRLEGMHPRVNLKTSDEHLERKFYKLFGTGDLTKSLLKKFHYVPFFRVATKYGEILTLKQDDFLNNDSTKIIRGLLNSLSKDPDLLNEVSDLMQQLTGKSIRPRGLDLENDQQGTTIDFVKDGFSNAITNEGTGPNQAILLLSVLAGTSFQSVLAIDEPEIHLHPKAQSKLGKIMIEIGKLQNKQIIFATHSEHMLYPFLSSIKSKSENSLTPDDVAIYYFSNTDENLSKVESLPINERGQIKGGLKGFWEEDLKMLEEFSKDD